MHIITLILSILIIGLFLYSKLLPYKDKLYPQYKGAFDFFESVFTPVFNALKKIFPPFQVGDNLAVDMTQMVLLVAMLILMGFFG